MAGESSVQVTRDIETLFAAGTTTGLSDRQLLERFSSGRDASAEAAFEAIVRRHGPMVLRLCYKMLANQADAEEAFQATFLILVKKCRSIRQLDTMGGWLFGVASRVAARAQVVRSRRRTAERQGGLRIATAMDTHGDGTERVELDAAVEAEVLRLPEKYRAVVFLCYWDGLTHEQAADRLGCPVGTIRSRIARARELLRRRLSRRGLEPVAVAMATAFDSLALNGRALEIPELLVSATVRLAKDALSARSLTELTSPSIAALVQNIIGSMFMAKMKSIALCIFLIGAGAYGLTLAAEQIGSGRRSSADAGQLPVAAKSKTPPPIKLMIEYVVEPPDLIVVEVLDTLPGRPIGGERLVRPDGNINLGFYGDVYVAGLTLPEVKRKIVEHLRKFLHDDVLGLIVIDNETDEPARDANGEYKRIDPVDTDRVFVNVAAFNSKNYYVLGEVLTPGRLPVTGQERILDAISFAGGLTPEADQTLVHLYRVGAKGEPAQTLKIDVDQIMLGDDLSTNYQLLAGDRLVVERREGLRGEPEEPATQSPTLAPKPVRESARVDRAPDGRDDKPTDPAPKQGQGAAEEPVVQRLEKRINEMERKLDLILDGLKRQAR
jgi:RNA polymerase sigma factor (sigma-70 family)